MYFDFFGLKEAPFRITPNTEYWYAGGQRGEMLAALVYAIGQGEGIIKVVGEVGSGKTMLCRKLAAHLPDSIDSVYLGNPTLEPDDMLAAILADLGIDMPENGRQARLAQLNAALLARHAAGRRVVVFVEEAQGITLDNLEFLRLLTNLETATDKLLQIVLFGQPELDTHLADPRIRQLKDRITLSLNLSPLTEGEVADYLRARLAVAGYRGPDLFAPQLIVRMRRLSGGLSRRINVLADKALLAAYAEQTHTLAPSHLEAAADDADVQAANRPTPLRSIALALALAAVLGLLAFVAWQARSLDAQRGEDSPEIASPPPRAAAPASIVTAAPGVAPLATAKEAPRRAVLLGDSNARAPGLAPVLSGCRQVAAAQAVPAGTFAPRRAA